MMKKLGYTPVFAGAVEAAASNGGSIMPPIMGTVAFIMADYLGISYGEVCIASIIPAVSYYLCIFAQVHFEAKKLGLLGLTRDAVPPFWNSLLKGWYIVVVLAALVIFLMVFRYTPGRTGYYCIGLFILVSSITRNTRLNLKQILEALKGTMMMLMKLAPVMAAAGVIMASFGMSGLGLQLAQGIVSFSGGYTFILLLLAAVMSFIMGMGLYALVSYILLAVMVGPILTKAGIPPLASHLFFFWASQWSHVTPPVASACFVAAPLADAPFWPLSWRSMVLSIPMYILPFLFVYNPAILGRGNPIVIAVVFVGCIMGVTLIAAGVAGYFIRAAGWLQRIVLLISGFFILFLLSFIH